MKKPQHGWRGDAGDVWVLLPAWKTGEAWEYALTALET